MIRILIPAMLAMLLSAGSLQANWQPVLQDRFDRPMLGPDWRVMRGDWRIEDGQLRVTRAWPSDNSLISTLPLPRGDVRAVVGLLAEEGSTQIALRCGEHHWGGGGYPDDFSIHIQGRPDTPQPVVQDGALIVQAGKTYELEMIIEGDQGRVLLDGERLIERTLAPQRSEINRSLYLNSMPNGTITRVALFVRPDASLALPIMANSTAENQQATIDASHYIDPANPAQGMQQAIDALPPTGGVVILPKGHFIMRRHLALRSGVTLVGQGWDQTRLEHAPIHETAVLAIEQDGDVCRVTVEDVSGFQVGDAMCFGRSWSHIVARVPTVNRDMVLLAIDGNVLRIQGYAPEDDGSRGATQQRATIKNFHPLIYCVLSEFVQVTDMTLRGPASGPGGGGFNNCPITFGNVYAPRIQRLNIEDFPADGVSVQRCGDAMVTDNTVGNAGQNFHPGTFTQRFLWARNLSVEGDPRNAGLFFCFANENGVYHRSSVGRFTGYPFVGNNFNVISGNTSVGTLDISSSGYAGLITHNRMPAISTAASNAEPGFPRYFSGPSYYMLAANELDTLSFGAGSEAIVIAANATASGETTPTDGVTERILVAADLPQGDASWPAIPMGVGRDGPVDPPALPTPIVHASAPDDGQAAHDHFQKQLNALAASGGTLQLPAGRYALAQALRIPAGVSLVGHGVATVLYANDGYTGSLLVSEDARNISVRNLTLRGHYTLSATRDAAIDLTEVREALIQDVDIRGWDGVGMQISGVDNRVVDCRVIGAAASGYRLSGASQVANSLARECGEGFVLTAATAGSVIEGCIASGNRGDGVVVRDSRDVLLNANNSHFNHGAGYLLQNVESGWVLGNLARGNNTALSEHGGIDLRDCTQVTVAFNHASDDQIHATQAMGLQEDANSRGNRVVANLLAPFHQPYHHDDTPALVVRGSDTITADNLVHSAFPTGSSLEWYALGFEGTPQSHGRQQANLQRAVEQAQRELQTLRSRENASAEAIAAQETAVRRAELTLAHFEAMRDVRSAKVHVMRLTHEHASESQRAAARAALDAQQKKADTLAATIAGM